MRTYLIKTVNNSFAISINEIFNEDFNEFVIHITRVANQGSLKPQ